MRKQKNKLVLYTTLLIILSIIISCSKSDNNPIPLISFQKNNGYIYRDTVVARGATVKIGIVALTNQSNDSLTKFTVVRTYDNTFDSTLESYNIPSSQADSLTEDFVYSIRDTVGTEKYTFKVLNKYGVSNSIKLIVTTR